MVNYPVIDFLRLVRLPNLVVVVLTQALVYYRIILPALRLEGVPNALSNWKFTELAIVTLLITASGYLINDLRDVRADEINRPGKNAVSRLGESLVMWFYAVSLLGGFLVSLLLAFRLNQRELLWIFPVAFIVLTLYSQTLKRIPFVGNFVVAAYCAAVPGILMLAERSALTELFSKNPGLATDTLRICVLFMVFAFVATWLRELVKDLEDIRGDRAIGRKTVPVLLGVSASRRLAVVLGIMVFVAILSPIFLGWPAFLHPPMMGCIGLLLLALVWILIQIARAKGKVDYHRLSTQLKLFLLGGLGLLIFF
jgi:4-hydroxybenzoate polyprenyltransferase